MTNVLVILLMGLVAVGAVIGRSLLGDTDVADDDAPAVEPGTYQLDGVHSEVGFRVKHLGISTVKGSFTDVDATITFPSSDLKDLKVEAAIAASSINTNNDDRDNHLRSADFFEVEKYPAISFTSREIVPGAEGLFSLKGDLTMHGITRPVELEAQFLGSAVDPWGNQRVGFTAEGKVNRKDFGLNWNKALETGGLLVGDNVTIVLDVQAMRKAE